MSNDLPATLVGYEIAVMEALRRELGADLNKLPQPDSRGISEAFFRRTPPLDYAWKWMQEVNARRQDAPEPPRPPADDGTLELL